MRIPACIQVVYILDLQGDNNFNCWFCIFFRGLSKSVSEKVVVTIFSFTENKNLIFYTTQKNNCQPTGTVPCVFCSTKCNNCSPMWFYTDIVLRSRTAQSHDCVGIVRGLSCRNGLNCIFFGCVPCLVKESNAGILWHLCPC